MTQCDDDDDYDEFGGTITHDEIPVRVGDTHQVHALHQRVELFPFERRSRRHSLDHNERIETFDTSFCRIYALLNKKKKRKAKS